MKKVFITTGLFLMLTSQAYSQLAEKFTVTMNNDTSPLNGGLDKGSIFVKVKALDIVNFDFNEFSVDSERLTIEITDKANETIFFSQKVNELENKNKFDLVISELDLPSNKNHESLWVSLVDDKERQLIFRFKVID